MYDAIIVGARCAGAPTAMQLARKGHKVLLLDRDPLNSNMAHSTHLIHPEGVARLIKWGLYDNILKRCKPFKTWSINLHGINLEGIPPAAEGNIEESIAPRRNILDSILLEGAHASGSEIRGNCRVAGLTFDDGAVSGIRARSKNGRTFTERAHIVIGADGPSSIVAKSVNALEYKNVPPLQSNIWSYWKNISIDCLKIFVGPRQGAFAFPTSDDAVLVATNLPYDMFKTVRGQREHHYWDMLAKAAPTLYENTRKAKRIDRFFAGCTRSFVRQTVGRGWALVGDAGMKKDPITAQGIAVAFEYAEKLASSIHNGLLGGKKSLEDQLEIYATERDKRLLPYYDFTVRLAALAPPSPSQLAMYQAMENDSDAIKKFFGTISLSEKPVV